MATSSPTLGTASLSGEVPVVLIANGGISITNSGATTDVPYNVNICDMSGYQVIPGGLRFQWNNLAVRKKSYDERHPQELLRAPRTRRRGSRRPEPDNDTFIEDAYPNGVDADTDL